MSAAASLAAIAADGESGGRLARLDPRLRLVFGLGFALLMPLLTAPLPLLLALLTGLAALALAGIPWRRLWPRLVAAEGFLLVLLVTLPFAIPGTPLLTVFGLSASLEGTSRVLILLARIHAALFVLIALVGTLGSRGLAAAMQGLGLPPALSTLLQMTLRYAVTLGDEYRRLRTAMRVRGFRMTSSLHAWRSLGNLVGMLLVRSLERAERVRWAMLCRGFSGRFPAPPQHSFGRPDAIFAALAVILLAALVALEGLG